MSDIQEAADALALPFVRTIKGKEYRLELLNLTQVIELHQWAEQKARKEMLQNIADLALGDDAKIRLLFDLKIRAGEILASPEASRLVIHGSLQEHHKELTLEQVGKLCSMRDMVALGEKIQELSAPEKEGGKPDPPSAGGKPSSP